MKEINLKIEGMHCVGCSTRLEKVLNNLEGIETAKVSLEEKKATIKYDETKINIETIKEAIEDAGFKVGAGLVWKKDRLVLTRTDWKYIHEPIIFGWKKDGKHNWYGDQKQVTVFEFDRIKNSKEDGCGHPSSKPVPLIAYLIGLSTQMVLY